MSIGYDFILSSLLITTAVNLQAQSWPLTKAPDSAWPQFEDNLAFERMDLAIDRQLSIMEAKKNIINIDVDGRVITSKEIIEGLKNFKALTTEARLCLTNQSTKQVPVNCLETVNQTAEQAPVINCLETDNQTAEQAPVINCLEIFNQKVRLSFDLYQPKLVEGDSGHGEQDYARFTGYYSPELEAANEAGGEFSYPIYGLPQEKELRTKSRDEIDFNNALDGKGLELAYGNNLYDLYMLQVQGGGALLFTNEDGTKTRKYLSYAGGNGQPFDFLFKYMLSKGYVKSGSVANQRSYITENPDKQREIFSVCPNYVFFKYTDHEPLGVNNIILTEGRSIAQDINLYKIKGLISYVSAILPQPNQSGEMEKQQFSRFFIDQDTGGAIRGKARADLYLGFGETAKAMANSIHHMGSIVYLLPKVVQP